MATTAAEAPQPARPAIDLKPNGFDRLLALGAAIMLVAVLAALVRGRAEWPLVPLQIWAHLLTIIIALALTPVMLLRRRGDRLHRRLGWVWASAMLLTALLSFTVRVIDPPHFSLIHLLSAWTVIQVPLAIFYARRHDVRRHRRSLRLMVAGALLIAGFFTFPFQRLLGHWLFG